MSKLGPVGLPRRGQLIDHALDFGRTGGPVELIVLVGIVALIQVELHRGVAVLLRFGGPVGEHLRRRQPLLIQRGVEVEADAIAEFSAKQLVHRHVQRLAREIPQRRFHRREHRDVDAGLRAPEDAALANLLEQPMHVERTLIPNALPEALHHVVGAANGVDRFAAAPDPLVRVDLDEQASAYVAGFEFGDAQRGRARRLLGVVHRLPERFQRPGRGGAGHRAGRQEGTPTVARLVHKFLST